jgi:hypothetical protein
LVDDNLLLRDFGPYEVIFMNVCVVTVAMSMLIRDFWPYRIIFMSVFTAFDFSVALDGKFTSIHT